MSRPALRPAHVLAVLAALLTFAVVPVLDGPDTASAATSDACGARIAKPGGGLWDCSFVDDFNGASLDTTKWAVQDTSKSGFYMNKTCFQPGKGYAVGGGNLTLTVDRSKSFQCKKPIGGFRTNALGGAISTYGKFTQTYGRYEARIKFPAYQARGLHGGFWMNPQDLTYGRWPASGEIDVSEWYSAKIDQAFPSLHYRGSTDADTELDCVVPATDQFHTYTVEWSATSMQFYYDGQLCFDRMWSPTGMKAPAPFDKPFTASLIAAQGAGWNSPDTKTPKLAATVVDYVKVWR